MSHEPIKVAHLVLGLRIGGLEMVVANIVKSATANLFHHSIYCLDETGDLATRLVRHGTPVTLMSRRVPRDWTLGARLATALRRSDVDVIHAHNFTPFFYACLASVAGRIPVIATFHNTHLVNWSRARVAALRTVGRRAAFLVSVSQKTQDVLAALVGSTTDPRLVFIPNGVDLNFFAGESWQVRKKLRESLDLGESDRVIGSVGRLSPEKDYPTLIHAFAQVRKQDESARLIIAGDGPEHTALRSLVESLALQNSIRLLGSRDDVKDLLATFDLFALSSVTEGTSVALLEAMAARLPVVATRVGGNIDLITPGIDGVLVNSQDVTEMATALARVLGDPKLAEALGSRARATIEARYSLQRMSAAYEDLYRRATNHQASQQQ